MADDPAADDGLYLHNVTTTTITTGDGEPLVLVSAADYMRVQKERDDYKRALALINAWRLPRGRDDDTLHRLLQGVGFDIAQAHAMQSLIAWARTPEDRRG